MDPSPEEQRKAILPFLQRAQEVAKTDAKIAYYCRLYVVDQALQYKNRSAEVTNVVMAVMKDLELTKPSLELDQELDKHYCEEFAWKVFLRADSADRAGTADKDTATGFYAASIFFEVCRQFGQLAEDIEQKQRYAAWRAVNIRKAVKAGLKPAPPPGTEGSGATAAADALPSAASARLEDTASGDALAAAGAMSPHASVADAAAPEPNVMKDAPSVFDVDTMPGGQVLRPPSFREQAATQRFEPGHKVLYSPSGAGGDAVRGTVVRANVASDGTSSYDVAVSSGFSAAPETHLAPWAEISDRLLYSAPGQDTVVVTLAEIITMQWPPSYSVVLDNGSDLVATASCISLPPVAVPSHSNATPAAPAALGLYSPHPQQPAAPPAPAPTSSGMYPPSMPMQPLQPGAPPAAAPPPPAYAAPLAAAPPPPVAAPPAPAAPPPAAARIPPAQPGFKPSLKAITEAQKAARSAVSSLNFEDTARAVEYLQKALQLLLHPS